MATNAEGSVSKRRADGGEVKKFVASNWHQPSYRELRRMAPQALSRYMAYEPMSKEVEEAKLRTLQRVREHRTQTTRKDNLSSSFASTRSSATAEQDIHKRLMGQLKAAEARGRTRDMYSRYNLQRQHCLHELIARQPTALHAIRMKAFLPLEPDRSPLPDLLSRIERNRITKLIDDETGFEVARDLTSCAFPSGYLKSPEPP